MAGLMLRVSTTALLVAGSIVLLAVFINVGHAPEAASESLELTSGLPLIVETTGSSAAPDTLKLRVPGDSGVTLLELVADRAGLNPTVLVRVTSPDGQETHLVSGTMLIVGDVSNPSFKVEARQGTTETLSVRTTRTGMAPFSDIWVNATGDKHHYHIEPPLRYHEGAGGIDSLTVVNPSDGKAYLTLTKVGTRYRIATDAYTQEVDANQVAFSEDANGRITFILRGSNQQAVQTLVVDRAAQPARIMLTGQITETIVGPVSLAGSPSSPTRLSVHSSDGAVLLVYTAQAGKSSIDIAGSRVISDATFLRLEGDPFGDAFTLVLRDASGVETPVKVDRRSLLSASPIEPPIVLLQPLTALSGMPPSQLLRVQDSRADGPNFLGPGSLKGTQFLQSKGTHSIFLQTSDDAPQFERIYARISSGPHSIGAPFSAATLASAPTAQAWRADYATASLGLPADGTAITLGVFYEKRLAPFAVQRYQEATTYSYLVDGTPPEAAITVAQGSSDFRVPVQWSGTDSLTGISGYEVQSKRATATIWEPWIAGSSITSAIFSGDWDQSYQFRARSLDGVGNPSAWQEATTIVGPRPAGLDDVNDPPTVRLLSPLTGDRVSGIVEIRWHAVDPDGTPVTTTVQISADDGRTWRTIFSGIGGAAAWDTRLEPDGNSFRLRLTTSDGSLSNVDASGAFSVVNLKAGASPAGGSGGIELPTEEGKTPEGPAANVDEEKKRRTPGVGVIPLVAIAAALAYTRRRSK